jgi:hypothetical protein
MTMRLAVCTLVMFAAAIHAQEPASPKAEPEQPPPMQGSASGTKKDEGEAKPFHPSKSAGPATSHFPTQYLLYVAEAMKSFQARDFAGALSYADRADALLPPTVWTLNVRGAVAIERHDFAGGEKFCLDALKMDQNFFPAKFNLCEIPFLQGKYDVARKGWQALYDHTAPDDPTVELLVYRIFLTYLLESNMPKAKEWLTKLPFPSQTPAYQYANAAWERQNGNLAKWEEWIESADFIWPLSKRSSFSDVLVQLKWLKSDAFQSK